MPHLFTQLGSVKSGKIALDMELKMASRLWSFKSQYKWTHNYPVLTYCVCTNGSYDEKECQDLYLLMGKYAPVFVSHKIIMR